MLWHRAVAPDTKKCDIQLVGSSVAHSFDGKNASKGYWHRMQGNHVVRPGHSKPAVKPVFDHCFRTSNEFFCRLTDKNQRSAPLIPEFDHCMGHTEHPANMRVVATHMSNGDFTAICHSYSSLARVRQTCGFLHSIRIHVGPV